jgi:ectoine hydroxylase-related dioxygenase (phytanoyl-CoA dioxygenase family)
MRLSELLLRDGFLVLDSFLPSAFLRRLSDTVDRIYADEGDRAGAEFRLEPGSPRLANLVDKDPIFLEVIANPAILGYVETVLGPRFKLSSLNARAASPGQGLQPLHVDMGLLPDERGNAVCNTLWMLDDFTAENGAMRVVPGSHTWGKRPQEALDDPNVRHPKEILVTAPAGTVVVVNAHTWHGGTTNRTAKPRRALHSFYARWDIPQQQHQKRLLRPEVQAGLTPRIRELLALDDAYNDEISMARPALSGFLK